MSTRPSFTLASIFVAGSISALAPAGGGDTQYRVVPLPVPEGAQGISAYALNNSNEVAGGAWLDPNTKPFIYSDGVTTVLDQIPGIQTHAEGISDAGHLSGWMYEWGVIWPTAFLWDGSECHWLVDPAESNSYGQGMNDLDMVVGFYYPPGGHANGDAFVCVEGEYVNLGSGQARDINNKGMIVGQINRYFGETAIWEPDGNGGWNRTVLDGLLATAINESGSMFVGGGPLSVYFDNAVVWTRENNEWVRTQVADWDPNSTASISLDVNNREQVVGNYDSFDDGKRGWIYQAGTVRWLDDMLAPGHTDWEIVRAMQINEAGVILADARPSGSSDYGDPVLLVPDSLTMLGARPGVAGASNDFTVTSAEPGKHVYFVYGTAQGYRPVPGCTGLKVSINSPKILGKPKANANGEARISRFVPENAKGVTIYLQAVQPSECTVSNLMPYTFN